MRGRPVDVKRWLLVLLGALSSACGISVRAVDAVTVDALKKTDCDGLTVTKQNGGYLAVGCGKKLFYRCDRPSGTALTKPAAVANAGCREEPLQTGALRTMSR